MAWKELFPYLLATYRDGFVVSNRDNTTLKLTASKFGDQLSVFLSQFHSLLCFPLVFYPQWWLDAVGYFNNKPNPNPAAILFAPKPEELVSRYAVTFPYLIAACLFCASVAGMGGYYAAKRDVLQRGYDGEECLTADRSSESTGVLRQYRGYSTIRTDVL